MNKKIVRSSKKNKSEQYFDCYSREVNVIGFKQSWVTEINNEMKEVYEKNAKEKNYINDKERKEV